MHKETESHCMAEASLLIKRRVLVVEDDEGLNHLAQKMLRRAGFETEGVLTGSEALERITSGPELTALIDQQLPDMKGTELIGTLNQRNYSIPFVAMTCNGDEGVAIEMMKLGARDYLIKGFGFIDLLPEAFLRMYRELDTEKRLDSSEKALRQSEERFKLAMEVTQDGLWDWNVETDEVYLSPSCSTILGYNSDEFQLDINDWNNLIHSDDKAIVFKAYSDCIENHNDDFQVEYRMQGKNGKWFWILGRGKVVSRKDSGRVTRIVGTHTDITRLKKGKAELATQAATLNTIFNSTSNILILVNEERRVEKINHKGITFSGRKEDELIGRLGGEVLRCINSIEGKGCGLAPNCSLCPVRTRVDATFQTGTPFHEEEGEMTVFSDNKRITLNLLISTVSLTVGKSEKVLVTITNISDFKRAELERRSLEKRLHQAQKMESIGMLAGGIAHDFNNILTAILGYTEMAIYDSKQGSTINEDLGQVIKAGNRAKKLVQQILTFSRQGDTERSSVQPGSIVREAIKMLRSSLPTTIEINQKIDSDVGFIYADPTQIHQIVMNFGTNAFHAMEETGGKLDISLKEVNLCTEDLVCEPYIEAGTFIQLSICDSGPGIAPTIKDKIFDPYFTTKETGKGTGMGLSIVHGIVTSYGGFISLCSELGEGTAFYVFLPVIENEALPEIKDVEQIPVGRERILFIDDEEILAEMGKDMLERLGYHVTVRYNSIDALETFQNQPNQFDIIITDQSMPGMTGADIARRMIQIRPDIPIILCTGYSTIISEEKAKSMGIKEFVLKPLSKKDIAVLIRKVLDNT